MRRGQDRPVRAYGCHVDEDPGSGDLPVAASQALARLLSQEKQISDLIAFLAGLDAEPLLRALDLPVQQVRAKREDLLGRKSERADLVVRSDSGPVALLEIKASAAEHGNQFSRYDTWARDQTPPARCFLIALDGDALDAPEGWVVEPTLPGLLRSWRGSPDRHAAWLASAAAGVLESWGTQADGKIRHATGPIVADLLARRIAIDLRTRPNLGHGLSAEATRTTGGTAMVLAYLPFPSQPRDRSALLCVDFRSMIRDRPVVPWVLRLGVEVEVNEKITASQARTTAHDLAMPVLDALTCTAVQQAFRRAGRNELAATLRPRRGSRDGLNGTLNERALSEWRENALKADVKHPLLAHDSLSNGYRLASRIEVDVADLDRRQLAELVLVALEHIQTHAARLNSGQHPGALDHLRKEHSRTCRRTWTPQCSWSAAADKRVPHRAPDRAPG